MMRTTTSLLARSVLLASAILAQAWTPVGAQIIKTIDRKFPIGWCPFESRGSQGANLVFTAAGPAARIQFQVRNGRGLCADTFAPCSADADCPASTCERYCHPESTGALCSSDAQCPGSLCGHWNHLELDNVAVVRKDVFDANVPGPSFGYEACYTQDVPPGQTSGGQQNAPAYDHDLGGPEAYLNLFDGPASVAGWSGQFEFDGSISAPRHPQDSGNLDETGGALAVGRLSDGSGPVSASFTVSGLTPGVQYVVFAWWTTSLADVLTMSISANACPDADGDGFVECAGGCEPDAGQTCGDCDDADPAIRPGVADTTCNGVDEDCDGQVDEGFSGGCPCTSTRDGLVGWWPGDGNGNDVQGGNHGVLENGLTFTAGVAGQAFRFDGSDDYVSSIGTPSAYSFIQNTGVFTIDAWIAIDDPDGFAQRGIVGNTQTTAQKGHLFLWDNPAGERRLRMLVVKGVPGVPVLDSYSPSGVITTGGWHHVAVVSDGASVVFWVDGVAHAGSGTLGTLGTGDSTLPLEIGFGALPFDGSIDEVHVWSRALRDTEILSIFERNDLCRCTDADLDGYGAEGALTCPAGPTQDCDDGTATVHPGAADATCNGIDDDCDGQIDEGFPTVCQCAEPGEGLKSWWPADGNAGDIRGGYGGVLQNGASYAAGVAGQAFALDGTNDYVGNMGGLPTYSFIHTAGVFTVAAWIRLNAPNALVQQAITANTVTSVEIGHFFLFDNSAGERRLRLGIMKGIDGVPAIDSVGPPGAITDTGWHHVAAVGDGAGVRFFVDGVGSPGTGSFGPPATADATRVLDFGRCPAASPQCQLGGMIDEVQIYDRALGDSEVRAIFASGSTGMCRCIDADSDGRGASGGLTCPSGLAPDCDDANPLAWGVPSARNLLLNGKVSTILSWDDESLAAGPGVVYDIERGPILGTPVYSGPWICLEADVVTPSAIENTVPAPGSGFVYLVWAHNACGGDARTYCP